MQGDILREIQLCRKAEVGVGPIVGSAEESVVVCDFGRYPQRRWEFGAIDVITQTEAMDPSCNAAQSLIAMGRVLVVRSVFGDNLVGD